MIDLHCHVLAGLDDGPLDMTDSLFMVEQAQRDGITEICATPHIRHDHDVHIDELAGRVDALNHILSARGATVVVRTGGEIGATVVTQLGEEELTTVSLGGGGRWILLEPAPGPLTDELDAAVTELDRRGFRSVIAHPERHLATDMVERLSRLTTGGALIQATAATVLHGAARAGMEALARAGLIHVLGSDAHSARFGRRVEMRAAYDLLARYPPLAEHGRWVVEDAPAAIVAGLEVTPPYAPRSLTRQ